MREFTANRQYSNNLFVMLFGGEGNRNNILSLYNALSGKDYKDPDAIEITTIEDIIYIRMKNDLSFIIGSQLNRIEQQSTYNPNMPLRGLMYLAKLYSAYISSHELNIYSTSIKKIPRANYIVLYNGVKGLPAYQEMLLSDAYMDVEDDSDDRAALEVVAKMYNLNAPENAGMLKACDILNEYVKCVNIIRRKKQEIKDPELAVNAAIAECIELGILKDFLIKHRAEVLEMCLTEFDEEAYKKDFIEIGREEGRAEGREEGRAEGYSLAMSKVIRQMNESGMPKEDISSILGISATEVQEYLDHE